MHLEWSTVPCLTCFQFFRSRNQRRCLKCRTRSIIPYYVKRSTMHWLRELQALSGFTFKSTSTMEFRPLKLCSASLTPGRCSSIEWIRYALTSRVRVGPVTILQLTTFGLWKRMDSIPHPSGRSLVTRPVLPWPPPGVIWACLRKIHILPQAIVVVRLRLDLRLTQENHIQKPVFYRPDGLHQSEASAIPDI